MSREHHDLGRAGGTGTGTGRHGSSSSSKAFVWDTGSSLYDSYELAAVRRLLDGRLRAAGAGVLPLPDEVEPPAAAEPGAENKRVAVAAGARRKVTLRALFRAVATWAARPRQAPLACACAGTVHRQGGASVEPADVPSHGQL
ncbi:uncharacterized protein LOC120707451 [Panicum virgatum]|uniref:Uncharacterized protein n=1 Tax=Panicum virgatum TaxID=38727 RepID=A0A8T0SSE5_PANVG|nr:uncharacterized protein LOC120707451 [Panicum virgatum]KAG2599176.1 hypothetical protein PVAP13_5KG460900 [Panicum virgatum]